VRPDNGCVPTTSQWLAFVIASALFIQVPGPSLLFTIGRALTVGRRDALLSVMGNALGITTQVLLVALGFVLVFIKMRQGLPTDIFKGAIGAKLMGLALYAGTICSVLTLAKPETAK
jgi:hypothetical protein